MRRKRIVIVGAGLAGAAVAERLVGERDVAVVLVEAAGRVGRGASGRSAGMIRGLDRDPAITASARRAVAALRSLVAHHPEVGFHPRGSVLLGESAGLAGLRAVAAAEGVSVGERAAPHAPVGAGIFSPDDGVIDVPRLLEVLIARAAGGGARIARGLAARALRTRRGRVTGVVTELGVLEADVVIDACGAACGRLGAEAGGRGVALEPRRRHVFEVLAEAPRADDEPDFVWDVERGWYWRRHEDAIWTSICDDSPAEPVDEKALADEVEGRMHAVFSQRTTLGIREVRRRWSGLRTFAADERFVIGPDGGLEGLILAGGLGGHGVTCCLDVGRIAAGYALDDVPFGAEPFTPIRLARPELRSEA